MQWNKSFRGSDQVYGESIYTKRGELIGSYQLPFEEKLMLSFSGNVHYQDSRYGTTSYIANQKIGFLQLTWDKKIGRNDLLAGIASRYTYYDDNTPATKEAESTWLPGIFVQDEITFSPKSQVLLGMRYDYNSIHGSIYTPRIAYRWKANENTIFRLNAGTGFRVVNLFTEDHAALTGSRDVVIKSDLKPERSVNANLNYIQKIKRLYNLSENENYGFSENQIIDLEKTLDIKLPSKFKEYYLELGKEENLNFSFNRLLEPDDEIEFSDDNYLVFYEENQISPEKLKFQVFDISQTKFRDLINQYKNHGYLYEASPLIYIFSLQHFPFLLFSSPLA